MEESEESQSRHGSVAILSIPNKQKPLFSKTTFNRQELGEILKIYGRKVSEGEWRDYAIDLLADRAVFSVFRHSSDFPLFRIEKNPKLARKQGAYSVLAPGGLILKRGHELKLVLQVLEKKRHLKIAIV